MPIGHVRFRSRAHVRGRVRSLRVRPWNDAATLEVTIVDDTGGITAVFLGYRRIGGLELGTDVELEGMVGEANGQLVMRNPVYTLLR